MGNVKNFKPVFGLAITFKRPYFISVFAVIKLSNVIVVKSLNLKSCLLYTSDAADERSSVDLGGRRIIKKKKNRI